MTGVRKFALAALILALVALGFYAFDYEDAEALTTHMVVAAIWIAIATFVAKKLWPRNSN